MSRLLRSSIMIVAAMLGSAVVLAGIIIAAMNLATYGSTPPDFLSSEHTVAIFHQPDTQTLDHWSDVFPVLNTITHTANSTIGVIKKSDGRYAAAMFTLSRQGDLGPYALKLSDASIAPLIGRQPSSVGQEETYRQLHAVHQGTPWVYVAAHSLPPPSGIRESVEHALLYGDSTHVGIEGNGNAITTIEHSEQQHVSKHIATLNDTVVRVSLASPQNTWRRLQQTLSSKDALILDGLLNKYLALWGTGISAEYDVWALLSQPATVHITASGSIVNIVLEGTHSSVQERDRILDRIHTSFASVLPATTVTSRVLDKRFSALDIRHDASQIQQKQYKEGQWHIRETFYPRHHKRLVSATKGSAFLLGNNLEAIKQAIVSRSTQPPVGATEVLTSVGEINLGALHSWLAPLLPIADHTSLLKDSLEDIRWKTVVHGPTKRRIFLDSLH